MNELDNTLMEKLKQVLKNWQNRLIDVSKSNPLLGINRSRVAKLEVSNQDFSFLIKRLIDEEGVIKMPFVQKRKVRNLTLEESDNNLLKEEEEYFIQDGDINFIYTGPVDLKRKTKRIFDDSHLFSFFVYPWVPRYVGGGMVSVAEITVTESLEGIVSDMNPFSALFVYSSVDSLLLITDKGTHLVNRKDVIDMKFLQTNSLVKQIGEKMHQGILSSSTTKDLLK